MRWIDTHSYLSPAVRTFAAFALGAAFTPKLVIVFVYLPKSAPTLSKVTDLNTTHPLVHVGTPSTLLFELPRYRKTFYRGPPRCSYRVCVTPLQHSQDIPRAKFSRPALFQARAYPYLSPLFIAKLFVPRRGRVLCGRGFNRVFRRRIRSTVRSTVPAAKGRWVRRVLLFFRGNLISLLSLFH